MNSEFDRLEAIAVKSQYSAGINERMVKASYEVAKRWIQGPRVLELGPAEGIMTDLLVADGFDLTVVEGSHHFCEQIAARHRSINVVEALFENFDPTSRFNTILLGHVLEHVDDPVQILKLAKGWLGSKGRVFAAVPNARSLHRQAAVLMGLLSREDALNEADVFHGHRRVFDPESFRAVFLAAGFQIEFFGGYWLKPLSNRQIETHWSEETINAFIKMGERYPDIAGEIFVVAGDN